MAYISAPMLFVYDFNDYPVIENGIYLKTMTHYAYFTYAGKCELYSSLLWDVEYYTVGSFEIYLPASAENLALFQIDRIVARSDDTENYGVIESIAIEHDDEEGDYVTISGRFLPCLLERRVIFPTAYSTDITASNCPLLSSTTKNYGNMVKHVLLGGYGHPYYEAGSQVIGSIVSGVEGYSGGAMKESTATRNGRRMIPGLWIQDEQSSVWDAKIGSLSGDDVEDDTSDDDTSSTTSTSSGTMQVTGKNLMEWIYKVCEMVGGTIKIDASGLTEHLHNSDAVYTYMTLQLAEGEDKSDSIIFSDSLENIASMSFSENFEEYSNFAYICGSGEGLQRVWATSHGKSSDSSVPTGLDRHEIFISEVSNVGQDTDNTDESAQLMTSGLESLTSPTYATEAEIIVENGRYTYGTDYAVGDIVTIRYDRWGISLTARLVGMIESFDQSGRTLTPTFDFNSSMFSGGSSTDSSSDDEEDPYNYTSTISLPITDGLELQFASITEDVLVYTQIPTSIDISTSLSLPITDVLALSLSFSDTYAVEKTLPYFLLDSTDNLGEYDSDIISIGSNGYVLVDSDVNGTISALCDMTASTTLGISDITAEYTGTITVSYSYDNTTWTEDVAIEDFIDMGDTLYADFDGLLYLQVTLTGDATFKSLKITFTE